MKLSARERKLMFVLPAIAVLAVYGWWYRFYRQPVVEQAQKDHDRAIAGAASREAVAQQQTALAQLQREVKELDQAKARLDRDVAATRMSEIPAAGRLDADQALTSLLRRHHLELIAEEQQQQANTLTAKLPASLLEAFKKLGQKDIDKTGQSRTYKFAGHFLDVMQAVDDLAEDSTRVGVPISLTMAEAEGESKQRTWTLVIWM